jgi:hypothetical protein
MSHYLRSNYIYQLPIYYSLGYVKTRRNIRKVDYWFACEKAAVIYFKYYYNVILQVVTAASMKNGALWDTATCSYVEVDPDDAGSTHLWKVVIFIQL